MNKTRVEAFTDAIVAIAATIMVLELRVPEHNSVASLLEEWPVFVAYIISFVLIYIVWYNHHNIFHKAKFISRKTYLLNGIWLFLLTLVPFLTHWVGEYPDSTLPEFLYALDLLLWSILFQSMDHQIIRDNPGTPADPTDTINYRLVLYIELIVALIISFFWPIGCLFILGLATLILAIRVFFLPENK